ncbi:MAG: HFX_2341 family transcriptional regulator domain-containing protein [Promethearchaeota archaeon]
MKLFTQIILVGHSLMRLIEGIKKIPSTKLILVLGEDPNLEGEAKVLEVADELENIFSRLMEIKRIYVNKEDIYSATFEILNAEMEEIKIGHDVIMNVSGSLRQMAIACYIAALLTKVPIYSVIPKYDNEYRETGIEKIYYIPFFPIKELSKEKLSILKVLKKEWAKMLRFFSLH